MNKKMMAITLTTAMIGTMMGATAVMAEDAASSDEGKVLNIYCWNEEFKSRLTDHYPGYEEVDGTHGKIGDVDVVWNITPSDDNAYQNNLDETLLKQADAADDDKIDLFLVEADYALKYVNTDYAMPIKDLGITDDEIKDQVYASDYFVGGAYESEVQAGKDIVESLKFVLEVSGFTCYCAYNGEDGLRMAKELSPDLIILDVMMPKINGYKISRLLKYDKKYKDIPIIMVTARSQEEDKLIGEETGADEYITKPFDLDFVVQRVQAHLEG